MAYETQEVITRESPDIEAYKLGLMEQAKALASAPPIGGMPSYMLAGWDQGQTDAYNQAMGNVGNYKTSLDKGIASLADADSAFKASRGDFDPTSVEGFMNPFESNVIRHLEKDALKQNAMLLNQANLGSAGAGAFGGGRNAILQAQTSGDTADRLAKQTSNLRYQGYGDAMRTALGAYEGARGRDLSAGQAMAGLGGQYGGIAGLTQDLGFKDIGMQYDMGSKKQAQSQLDVDVARKNAMQNIMEPYTRLGWLGDMYQGMPASQNVYSSSYSADPGLLNQLIGAGTTGLGIYGAMGGFKT